MLGMKYPSNLGYQGNTLLNKKLVVTDTWINLWNKFKGIGIHQIGMQKSAAREK